MQTEQENHRCVLIDDYGDRGDSFRNEEENNIQLKIIHFIKINNLLDTEKY